jgi:hypothetical protein
LVIADTQELARDAAKTVVVEYEDLPAVISIDVHTCFTEISPLPFFGFCRNFPINFILGRT